MELLVGLVHRSSTAAVVATHDAQLVERADTVVTLHDGLVVT
jgi:putative ABC transport system ATP-binding protein